MLTLDQCANQYVADQKMLQLHLYDKQCRCMVCQNYELNITETIRNEKKER